MACFTNAKNVAELKETKDIQIIKSTQKNYLESITETTGSTTLLKAT